MTCPLCGTANPVGAKFCVECGTALALACPACGAAVSAGQRFCAECGTPLGVAAAAAPAPAPAAVGRRVCSILFCDLVGFTPISEARDPEAVRELLSRYFDTARTVIGRYGGTVEKFIGDAVMAVWGAERATEEDAERAVRAALELIAAVDALAGPAGVPDLAARAGVVTAEVAVTVGAMGEGMVAGDPVNTAARIQAAAEPRQVLCDDSTARRVRAAMQVDDAGARPLKGKAQPVQLWRPVRVLANVGGVQRIDGLEASLTGRDVELRILKDLFHASVEHSTSQLVTVVGEAGSGKSRLGWEFEKYVDGLAGTVLWHRGRCLSYGEGVTFWALTEMVRQRLGIADDDPPEVALTMLVEGLDRYVPDAAERDFVGVRLARLLGLPHPADDGRDLDRNDLFAGWRTWLTRLAGTAPVVWVIEDLQFADSALLDFLEHLLDWSRTAPIHVLALARPDLDEAAPGWTSGRRRQRVVLEPLDETSMRRLLDALVPGMPERAVHRMAEQAQGVPLFAVETIRALVDRDVVQPVDGRYRLTGELGVLDVPDSLRALFAARLDHLPPALRDLVATAAVLGTAFPAEAVASVAERPLDTVRADLDVLVSRDLLGVSADPLSPQRGSYAFTHDLLRRVAVDTLSRREQRARHLRVAQHMRATFPDDGEEVADVIAQHLLDAVDAAPDGDDVSALRSAAVAELARAAMRAKQVGAPSRAARLLQRAAAHVDGVAARADLLKDAAEAFDDAGDPSQSLQAAEHALDLRRSLADELDVARAETDVGHALDQMGRYAAAREHYEAARTVLERRGDPSVVRALRGLAGAAVWTGADDRFHLIEAAFEAAARFDVAARDWSALFLLLGGAHLFAKQRMRAMAAYRETLRLALDADDWRGAAIAVSNMSWVLLDFEPDEAAVQGVRALELSRRAGDREGAAFAIENLTSALIALGRWDEAAACIDDGSRQDGADDRPAFQFAAGRLASLRGDREMAARQRGLLAAAGHEGGEVRCSIALLDLFGLPADATAAEVSGRADAVIIFAGEFGINYNPVRYAWVAAARAAMHLTAERSQSLLDLVAPYLPTELCPMLRAEIRLAEARLSDHPEAAFPEAIELQRAWSPPHLLAEGLLDWAEHRIATGDEVGAADLIEEAEATAARLGARPVAERATRVRRRLPVRAA